MIRNRLSAILAITFAIFSSLPSTASASLISIDFDKGTIGNTVGNFYSELGITFNNTKFVKNFGWPGSSGLIGIAGIGGNMDWAFGRLNAIEATFTKPVEYLSINGIDVGSAGMQMDAYDFTGRLIYTENWYGETIPGGIGTGKWKTMSINFSDPIIARILLYQPSYNKTDGMMFDNLVFQKPDDKAPVPIPASVLILGSGLISLCAARLKKRKT